MSVNAKRAIVIVLAALITAGIVMPAAAAEEYCYAVINGKLFPCTTSYMPIQTKDGILCPSQFLLGAGLGFSSRYDTGPSQNYYTIYTSDKFLIFDLDQNLSFDSRWTYEEVMITRQNGVFYLPLDSVSKLFNFSYSVYPTRYGTAVRLKSNADAIPDDDVFSALETKLSQAQESYTKINSPSVNSSAAPSARPSPSPSARPSPSPSPPPAPVMYLSFDVGIESNLPPVLDILDDYTIPATFFATPEFMENRHGDIRRIIGSGYALGIESFLDMNSDELTESVIEELTAANGEMRLAALAQTRIVSVPAGGGVVKVSPDTLDALVGEGYRFWEWKIDAKDWNPKSKPDTLTANLLAAVKNSGSACHVRFSCNDTTVEVLKKLLPQLNQLNATYYAITDARPPNYRS